MARVVVVTRKGSFMAKSDIFLKIGFVVVDSAPPDFKLLVYPFGALTSTVKFNSGMKARAASYTDGLTIIRSAQCPYLEKNVREIITSAEQILRLKPVLIDLNDSDKVQQSPCAFGTFCILYNGKVIRVNNVKGNLWKKNA